MSPSYSKMKLQNAKGFSVLLKAFRRLRSDCGFTAVELLVALAVSAIILGLSYQGYSFFLKNFKRWQDRVLIGASARRAMQIMVKDFKTMRFLRLAAPEAISFIDDKRSLVSYSHDNLKVVRNGRSLLHPTMRLAKLQFDYRSPDGERQSSRNLAQVTSIGIELTVKGRDNITFQLVSSVNLRNKRSF